MGEGEGGAGECDEAHRGRRRINSASLVASGGRGAAGEEEVKLADLAEELGLRAKRSGRQGLGLASTASSASAQAEGSLLPPLHIPGGESSAHEDGSVRAKRDLLAPGAAVAEGAAATGAAVAEGAAQAAAVFATAGVAGAAGAGGVAGAAGAARGPAAVDKEDHSAIRSNASETFNFVPCPSAADALPLPMSAPERAPPPEVERALEVAGEYEYRGDAVHIPEEDTDDSSYIAYDEEESCYEESEEEEEPVESSEEEDPEDMALPDESRRPPGPGEATCVVCMEAAAVVTFVHGATGHTCACVPCAKEVQRYGMHCPVCRRKFRTIIRSFAA